MRALKAQYRHQLEMQLRAGPEWDNPHRLVFTNAKGRNLFTQYVNNHFRALVEAAGLEGVHFHDLRHSNVKPKTQNFSSFLKFFKAIFYASAGM